jgi:4-hydroxyphenylacetate 3-hydroxylase C terminal
MTAFPPLCRSPLLWRMTASGRVRSFGCTLLLIFATHAHKSPSWCTLRCGQATNADAKTCMKFLRLAFDAAVSSFSGRQQLYERCYSGDPVRLAGTLYGLYDKDSHIDRIFGMLDDLENRAAPHGCCHLSVVSVSRARCDCRGFLAIR